MKQTSRADKLLIVLNMEVVLMFTALTHNLQTLRLCLRKWNGEGRSPSFFESFKLNRKKSITASLRQTERSKSHSRSFILINQRLTPANSRSIELCSGILLRIVSFLCVELLISLYEPWREVIIAEIRSSKRRKIAQMGF